MGGLRVVEACPRGGVPERRRRGSMEGLASADTLRAGNPLRKELKRGPEAEKCDSHCHHA